jgi:hypothetical protein
MANWDVDYLNMEVPAFIQFEPDHDGSFQFGLVSGGIDYRVIEGTHPPRIEWSWQGRDENDEACGRGWAVFTAGVLNGHIFIHGSEESAFVATPTIRSSPRARSRRPRGSA